jgi:hypothetical protein
LAGKSKVAREGKLLVKNLIAKLFPEFQVKQEEEALPPKSKPSPKEAPITFKQPRKPTTKHRVTITYETTHEKDVKFSHRLSFTEQEITDVG